MTPSTKNTKQVASATKSAAPSGKALQQFAQTMGQEIVDSLNRAAREETSPSSTATSEPSPAQ